MSVFENEQFGKIRTVTINGEPWFVAKDVCNALKVVNTRNALAKLDEDEKGVVLADTPGGMQNLNVVSEAGLYALVFSSRKPEARAFKRWVIHDVIQA